MMITARLIRGLSGVENCKIIGSVNPINAGLNLAASRAFLCQPEVGVFRCRRSQKATPIMPIRADAALVLGSFTV